MTYTELSKSEEGTTIPVPTKTSLNPPASQTQVILEKSFDRFNLIIPKIGCSLGRCAASFMFICIFLPINGFVTAAVATENPIWYAGTALSVIGILVLPYAFFKHLYTQWNIVIEGGQLKIIETFRGIRKERLWSIDEVEKIESYRRRKKSRKSATTEACLVVVMSENTPFLDRYVQVGSRHPMLDDDTFDWMAREIAHFAEKPVVIPSYPSLRDCCN